MPREGHDPCRAAAAAGLGDFNPRAPRGARPYRPRSRRSTRKYFNPRAPRGARLLGLGEGSSTPGDFNPRAPRGARPGGRGGRQKGGGDFNPRAPRGARPVSLTPRYGRARISIHVPREGHDSKHAQFFRADLRKSYKYPAERDALPTKNVCKHIKTLG